MEVDVQLALDNLSDEDRKEIVTDSLYACNIGDLISEVVYRCDIEEVINSFKQGEIEEWLNYHAEEYGYAKMED